MSVFSLIVNPVSGKGSAGRRAARVAALLEAGGHTCKVVETRGPGDARRLAEDLLDSSDVLVALGGDGTLREIIEGTDASRPVGIIPSGTANVVARDLGIPRDLERAVEILLRGRVLALDLGRANGRPFLGMVGVGYDAEVVRALARRRRGPIRMTSYLAPALQVLARPPRIPLRVRVDGRELPDPVFGVVVANTRNYGGLFAVVPFARPDDGLLGWQAQRRAGRLGILCYACCALFGRRASPRLAAYGPARRLEISADPPAAVQVDGDPAGTTPLEVEIEPGQARILAPEGREDIGEE